MLELDVRHQRAGEHVAGASAWRADRQGGSTRPCATAGAAATPRTRDRVGAGRGHPRPLSLGAAVAVGATFTDLDLNPASRPACQRLHERDARDHRGRRGAAEPVRRVADDGRRDSVQRDGQRRRWLQPRRARPGLATAL